MKNREDNFAHKSKSWDMSSKRVKNAQSIANAIIKNVKLNRDMKIMDFGAGTGLLSYFIAPLVDTIIAVDNSPSMLEEFRNKSSEFQSKTQIIEADLSCEVIEDKFDGIISSMTIHHLEDTKALFQKFYNMLEDDGFIAIADLTTEDGSFHSDNIGVYHYGFDTNLLKDIARDVGFKNIEFNIVSIIKKPQADFNVFLMLASK
ncbi:methyltransferase, putative [hydrothermal vent metagenome]|uniref:Methyltransferase, putative n=1 Tax=hydrothermal vent metagenome TaxID=652676 RepID=A0A1W1EJ95_9ZZZZ